MFLPHAKGRVDAPDANWYICMQLPLKRHPVFDSMLARIQARDSRAHILLIHEPFSFEDQIVVEKRLADHAADLSRIHFLPKAEHHILMALFTLTDVIVDSYKSGAGANTAPESLECGAPIVTLPDKMFMSRGVLGFYNNMGLTESVGLVARDPDQCDPSSFVSPFGPADTSSVSVFWSGQVCGHRCSCCHVEPRCQNSSAPQNYGQRAQNLPLR